MDQSYAMILVGRFIQGIGAAGAFPIVIPLVGDIFKQEDDVSSGLGIVETANTFGKVLSPILGSALAMVIWFLPFMFIPLLCLISMLLVLFLVKSPKRKSEQADKVSVASYLSHIKSIFKNNGRWLYAIFAIGCICMLVIFGTLYYLSDLLEDKFNVFGVVKGCILAIPLAALCIASFITGKGIGKDERLMKWMIFAGLSVLSGSILLCGMVTSIYWLIAWIGLAGIGIGAALPCPDVMITRGIEKDQRGTMFYTISGICVLASVIALFAIKPKKDEKLPQKESFA